MGVTPWQAGQRITADRLNQITPRWSAWTPTWTTSTGANSPSLGNATVTGSYCQTGDVVFFRLEVTFGTTTSFGGGGSADNWRFSLPVTAATTAGMVGTGEAHDSSTGGTPSSCRYPLRCRLTSTAAVEFETTGGSTGAAGGYAAVSVGLVDAVTPFTWASSDAIRAYGYYQAA